jgi:cytochrome c peroxidase
MASVLRARATFRRGVFTARTNFTRAPARKFSTPTGTPPPKSNTNLYIGLGLGAALAGGALYIYSSSSATAKEAGSAAKSAVQVAKAASNFTPSKEDYQKAGVTCISYAAVMLITSLQVYNKVAEILEADDYDDGSYVPILVRLAWHSSGTYDKENNTGGR